ncbi:MAG: TolC family protein [Planctomycetes bacterium]|nr:TolC family protein [Planctomycetota bacterium]
MRLRFSVCVPTRTLDPRPQPSSAAIAIPVLVASFALGACQAPPRSEFAPETAIEQAAQLPAPLEFRVVGPEGGPLDEPDAADGALSIRDAVQRAVTSDPGLQAALARVRVSLAQADQARLLPNPVLSVVFRAGKGSPQFEASFVQEFVQALQRPTRASAADNRLRAVAADAVVAALDVISEVQERYVDAQTSAALLPLLEERLGLVELLVTTSQARLDAGEGTRSDVVTLQAQRVELQVSIDRARLDERTSRLRLARLIGEPSSAAIWALDPWTAPELRRRSERDWTDAALTARPEIQALAWRLKALGDEAALVRLLPWEGATAGLEAQSDGGWQIGPSISAPLPIFDSGDSRRAVNTAEQLEARHELTLAKRLVVEEVRVAYQALAASTANLGQIERELIPLQRQRRQLAEDAYRAGQTDVTPLFLAEQDLRVAQTQAIEVEAQAARALVRLQRAVGGPGVAERLADAGSAVYPSMQLAADRVLPLPNKP